MILTKRPDTMPTHQGEIAFPGGKLDDRGRRGPRGRGAARGARGDRTRARAGRDRRRARPPLHGAGPLHARAVRRPARGVARRCTRTSAKSCGFSTSRSRSCSTTPRSVRSCGTSTARSWTPPPGRDRPIDFYEIPGRNGLGRDGAHPDRIPDAADPRPVGPRAVARRRSPEPARRRRGGNVGSFRARPVPGAIPVQPGAAAVWRCAERGSRDRDRQVRAGGRTGSTTSRSSPAAEPATPRTSTSPGRSTRTSSSCRSSPSAMDGVVSPRTAVEIGRLGGLACLNLEGLWTRYEDPEPCFEEIAALDAREGDAAHAGDLRRADQARADRPAHPGDQGGRRHRVRVRSRRSASSCTRRWSSKPSSTCSSCRARWCRPSTSRRTSRASRSTSRSSSASSTCP